MRARLAVLSLLLLSPAALLAQQSGIVYQPGTGTTTIGSYSANCVPKATSSTGLSCGLATDDGSNFTITTGQLKIPNGSAAAPSLELDSTHTGLLSRLSGQSIGISIQGSEKALFYLSDLYLAGGLFMSSTGNTAATDVKLVPQAANVLAMRNGTSAQAFRIYNTYTDASNGEWIALGFSGNTAYLTPTKNGSGTYRSLYLEAGGISQLRLLAAGYMEVGADFRWGADNTYNIGASASGRPSTVYVAGALISGVNIGWSNGTVIQSPSSGVIGLYNNGATDFGRLQLGGTTSSFPSIKRNGAGIDFRLADDSAYASIAANAGTFNGQVQAGTAGGFYINGRLFIQGGASDGIGSISNSAGTQKILTHTTGAPSVAGSCGSTPSVAGQDTAMTITAGTGSPTSCAVTFQAAFSTAPSCIANAATTTTALNVATTTTTVTVSSVALTAGEKINVVCFGF